MNNYVATIHRTLTPELIERWQTLWDQSIEAHFFNAPQWFATARESFGIHDFIIITIEKESNLEAILPLVHETQFGVPVFCSPGERFVDKSSLLVRQNTPELLHLIVSQLKQLNSFYLQEVSGQVADMVTNNDKTIIKKSASTNYYLSLENDPLQYMSNKNRNKIKNKIKKYEGNLSYKCFRGDPEGLEVVFEMDKRSTKRKQGKSTFVRERERNFFKQLIKEYGANVTVDVLFYDNIPVIYGIGFTAKKTFYACVTAYDDEYSFLSPGKMLHFYLFERLKTEGKTLFDFSRGVTVLKKEFTPLYNVQYDLFYTNNQLSRALWQVINKTHAFILHNKLLYGTYLSLKKILYH